MNHPLPADDYAWPTCTTPNCGRELWVNEAGRQACRPCEDRANKHLTELPGLFAQLNTTAALMRGARKIGGGAGGSRVPPIPPRLEVLALTGPGGIATRLAAIEDSWRQALGWTVAPWRGSARQAVPEHIKFLINNLPWAADKYDSVGQDIEDLRRLHAEATAVAADERKPGNVKIGFCPVVIEYRRCAEQLYASARSFKTECPTCRTKWEGDEEWRQLRTAQEQVLAEDAGVAA